MNATMAVMTYLGSIPANRLFSLLFVSTAVALMSVHVPFCFIFRRFIGEFLRFGAAEFNAVFRGLNVFAFGFDALFGLAEVYGVIGHA